MALSNTIGRWRYRTLFIAEPGTHIPDVTTDPMTRLEFLTLLASWNGQQPGKWQYWEVA